jgi:hypothetical protein
MLPMLSVVIDRHLQHVVYGSTLPVHTIALQRS